MAATTTISNQTIEKSLDAEYERLVNKIDFFNAKNNAFTSREDKLTR